jgi:hypothetical protein
VKKKKPVPTTDDVNRVYLLELKRVIERDEKVSVCIDCKTRHCVDEMIELCPVHAVTSRLATALQEIASLEKALGPSPVLIVRACEIARSALAEIVKKKGEPK